MKKIVGICAIGILAGIFFTSIFGVPKPIRVQRPAGVAPEQGIPNQEQLELDDDEDITYESFKTLIEKKQREGLPFILARVLTRDDQGRHYVHYYEAHGLNGVYGKYPFTNVVAVNSQRDPVNRLPIQDIQYFTINSLNDQAFEYLCSAAQLLGEAGDNLYKMIFYANQTEDKVTQANGLLSLGYIYLNGVYGVEKNYAKAIHWFTQAANQQGDPAVSAAAKRNLGDIYYTGGNEVEKNYATAVQWWTQCAHQQIDPVGSARAKYQLGAIYFEGGYGLEKNYATAVQWYTQAINQQVDPLESAAAKHGLAYIYFNGGYGVERNYAATRGWFQQAIDQQVPAALAQEDKNLIEVIKEDSRKKLNEITQLEAVQISGQKPESEQVGREANKRQKMNEPEDNNNNNQ